MVPLGLSVSILIFGIEEVNSEGLIFVITHFTLFPSNEARLQEQNEDVSFDGYGYEY